MRVVDEPEFSAEIRSQLNVGGFCKYPTDLPDVGCVTGPGRSGALAAVYASHILGVPFIPYGQKAPLGLGRLLIIDTATESGATLRKACRKYEAMGHTPITLAVFDENDPAIGRVAFWYESPKPQRYRHEASGRAIGKTLQRQLGLRNIP